MRAPITFSVNRTLTLIIIVTGDTNIAVFCSNQNELKALKSKLQVLEDALRQNAILLNTSENARKSLQTKFDVSC